jgi:hypothetical protein
MRQSIETMRSSSDCQPVDVEPVVVECHDLPSAVSRQLLPPTCENENENKYEHEHDWSRIALAEAPRDQSVPMTRTPPASAFWPPPGTTLTFAPETVTV